MSTKMPPVPPAGRSPKGPGAGSQARNRADAAQDRSPPENLEQQDRQGDIKQNTTHQGYQQDR